MIVFVDFEASSLEQGSFPIEIGWVNEDGVGESHLIRPEPHWSGWDDKSERIHGISREMLEDEGKPAAWVARRVLEVLHPDRATGISDAPEFDGSWLNMLLGVVHPSSPPILLGLNTVLRQEVASLLERLVSDGMRVMEAKEAVVGMVRQVEEDEIARPRVRHRALPDAEGLRWRWAEVRRRVQALI
jgi:hypothetical protein